MAAYGVQGGGEEDEEEWEQVEEEEKEEEIEESKEKEMRESRVSSVSLIGQRQEFGSLQTSGWRPKLRTACVQAECVRAYRRA